MAVEKTTTDPVLTGIAGQDCGTVVEYEDKFYSHDEQGDTEWSLTGQNACRQLGAESPRGVKRLLQKLDPTGAYTWRTRTMRFPVTDDLNTFSFVSSNAAAAGSKALATVPITYDPSYVYLSTTETSGGLLMTSTTAGATTALALNAGTADSGVHATIKWGTTVAGSAVTIAAGATARVCVGLVNNTATALYGIGVDGATNDNKFCVVSSSTKSGQIIGQTAHDLDQLWHDVELVRKNGILTCYIDGTSYGTYGAGGVYLSTAAAPIGALVSTAGSYNANISVGEITVLTAAKTGS